MTSARTRKKRTAAAKRFVTSDALERGNRIVARHTFATLFASPHDDPGVACTLTRHNSTRAEKTPA